MSNDAQTGCIWIGVLGMLFGGIGGGCYVYPQYNVYHQRLDGEAQYQQAESSRKITILEAEAKLQAADFLQQAEVKRAEGVAKANAIIGESLKNNESYLRYLWITELKDPKETVIYVPTEANLPILEAKRLKE